MAKVVNTSQQLTHQALFPTSLHSRWINLQLRAAAGIPSSDFGFTPPLPNAFRLLEVKLTVFPQNNGERALLFIHLRTGSGKNPVEQDITTNWEQIIQLEGGGKPSLLWRGFQDTLRWEMDRLYLGEGRRLGCAIENGSFDVGVDVFAGFRISEG